MSTQQPTHHIIYIPGLGDRTIRNWCGQAYIIRAWRRNFDVYADYHIVGWSDRHESFDTKLNTLLSRIDRHATAPRRVSLVASSAGATMALHAYAKRKKNIHAVVLIAPALGTVDSVGSQIYALNPVFKTSMEHLTATREILNAHDRKKILIIKPRVDKVVALKYMNLEGSHYMHLHTNGHLWTIVASLTFFSRKLMQFIQTR